MDGRVASQAGETTTGILNYVTRDSLVNRRFVFPGGEVNTGRFEPHRATIRNARLASPRPTLDTHGFQLFPHRSAVKDFHDRAEIDAVYPREVVDTVKALTGADLVVPLGYLLRASDGGETNKLQPPAADVHVDMSQEWAPRNAKLVLEQHGMAGRSYRRFVCSSFWRTFSAPPQDWPLALCDGNSISQDEGGRNRLIFAEGRPSETQMTRPMPNEDELPAATDFLSQPGPALVLFPGHDPRRGRPAQVPRFRP